MNAITKLDAASRQLGEAIRMFFESRDALAIHTLAAAAQGILRDVAKAAGGEHQSILHDHPQIPAERRREWIAAVNAPRNFLKHADKDPEGTIEFDEEENEQVLLDAVLLHGTVATEFLSAANVYMGWFTTKHAGLRGAISNNQIGDYALRNGLTAENKEEFLELVDAKILIDRV